MVRMKANVIKILSAIANLLNWSITSVNYRRQAKRCAAYKRGWCKGERCSYCNPMSEEEAAFTEAAEEHFAHSQFQRHYFSMRR